MWSVCQVFQRSHRAGVRSGNLITMSEAVYNFQRIFNLRMGSAEGIMTPFPTAPWDR